MIISQGNAFNIPRSSGASFDGNGQPPVTEINIPMEPYGRMERMLKRGEKVEVEAEIKADFTPARVFTMSLPRYPAPIPNSRTRLCCWVLTSTHGMAVLVLQTMLRAA
ncbi:MAG: hypothetical protein MZV63_29995 [Marinilabiliales bacterium]|nr:hypothetical protein [Marinilabiliales bacterium]